MALFCKFAFMPGYIEALSIILPTYKINRNTDKKQQQSESIKCWYANGKHTTIWLATRSRKQKTYIITNKDYWLRFLGSFASTLLAFDEELTSTFILPRLFISWISWLKINGGRSNSSTSIQIGIIDPFP